MAPLPPAPLVCGGKKMQTAAKAQVTPKRNKNKPLESAAAPAGAIATAATPACGFEPPAGGQQ